MLNRQVQEPAAQRFSDVYVEKAVLGHILRSREIPEALRFLEPANFGDRLNRAIYSAMCAVEAQGKRIELALLMDQMRRDKTLNDLQFAGGLFYLYECIDLYPALGRGQVYAQRIADLAAGCGV